MQIARGADCSCAAFQGSNVANQVNTRVRKGTQPERGTPSVKTQKMYPFTLAGWMEPENGIFVFSIALVPSSRRLSVDRGSCVCKLLDYRKSVEHVLESPASLLFESRNVTPWLYIYNPVVFNNEYETYRLFRLFGFVMWGRYGFTFTPKCCL